MPKRLIFLIDGTNNDPTAAVDSQEYTNIFKLNTIFDDYKVFNVDGKDVYEPQFTYYYPGIGTRFTIPDRETESGLISWFKKSKSQFKQLLFGDDIEQLVIRAYINLCANYKNGDKIYIYGFSRGAVAARIFSRIVSDFGLLKVKYLYLIGSLWENFRNISRIENEKKYREAMNDCLDQYRAEAKNEIFWRDSSVEFLGLFDTVSGGFDVFENSFIVMRDTIISKNVKNALHLVALHDRRDNFRLIPLKNRNGSKAVREIWMPGVHSDVGGGFSHSFISLVSLVTMAIVSEDVADLALNKEELKRNIDLAYEEVREKRIAVNREGRDIIYKDRYDLILAGSEIHPVQNILDDKRILWKSTSRREAYRNEFKTADGYFYDKELAGKLQLCFGSDIGEFWVSPSGRQ